MQSHGKEQGEYLYQAVERHVLDMIESGSLGLGDRLPSLRILSSKTGLSLSTVNQAYRELERKGVIESRPRSGFFVSRKSRRLPRTEGPPPGNQGGPRPVTRSGLIRTVLECLGRPDAVPLGVIAPDAELLPLRDVTKITTAILRDHTREALDYAPVSGVPALRTQVALRCMEHSMSVIPEDTLITAGCLEALYISLRSVCRTGDTVLIQSPTYYCFLQLLENLGLRAVEVPSHPDRGVSPADIARALKTFDIAACVLAPNYNNPDASLTPDSAKREIVGLLARRDIPLIEDDVVTDLHFGSRRPGTYKQFDRDGRVLLCSSFSKTISGGFRVGWLLPGRYREKAWEIKATTNVHSSVLPQMAVAEYLRQGRMERHLRKLRATVEQQMDTMHLHLTRYFPRGTRVTHPEGGLVLWLELPEKVNAVDLFFEARDASIGIAPGAIFSTQDKFSNYIRLSCGTIWSEQIRQGLETLGNMARRMAE